MNDFRFLLDDIFLDLVYSSVITFEDKMHMFRIWQKTSDVKLLTYFLMKEYEL